MKPLSPEFTFERFRAEELRLLRNVARKAAAWLSEPGDPAVAAAVPELRGLLSELYELRARAREDYGWQ